MRSGSLPWTPPYVQWVIKVSKRCNLRCTYCYEFPSLADSSRMSFQDLEKLFGQIAERYRETSRRMDFVWHGGEPLLHRTSFYHRLREIQHEVLGAAGIEFTNSVQTNLSFLGRIPSIFSRPFLTT